MESDHLPSFSLADRVVLVTGASRGIGRGIVDACAAAGATVAVTSRSFVDAEAVAGEVVAAGGTATAHARNFFSEHGKMRSRDADRLAIARLLKVRVGAKGPEQLARVVLVPRGELVELRQQRARDPIRVPCEPLL